MKAAHRHFSALVLLLLVAGLAGCGREEGAEKAPARTIAFEADSEFNAVECLWWGAFKLTIPGQEMLSFRVPYPQGTSEDAMALLTLDYLNEALEKRGGDTGWARLEEVADGPDRLILPGPPNFQSTLSPEDPEQAGKLNLVLSMSPEG